MAILATRRRWLVTRRCAASRSPCSRQLLASIYSSCGSSIGNRRISSKYRDRPVSADRIGKAAARAMVAPFRRLPPFGGPFRITPPPEPATETHWCNCEARSQLQAAYTGFRLRGKLLIGHIALRAL